MVSRKPKKLQGLPTKGGCEVGACGERSVNPSHLSIGIMAFTSLTRPKSYASSSHRQTGAMQGKGFPTLAGMAMAVGRLTLEHCQ